MFEDAKAKLDRAEKHIAELEGDFIKFSKANPKAVAARFAGSSFTLSMDPPPLPAALAATLGDAVNNLRTSLDLLAFRLAAPGSKPKFPFSKSKENFPQELKKSGIADQRVRDYVENAVMPYKGGDDDIWALHDTDIVSKHHTLIPANSTVALRGSTIRTGGLTITGSTMVNSTGRPFIISDFPIEVTGGGTTETTMHFTKESGFGQVPIIPKLRELSTKLRGIIADIERLVG